MEKKSLIDRTIPVPAYFQLKEIIRGRIKKKVYIPNETIITENGLIDEFKISRTTVRQALSELAYEGFVERRKGIGTIILDPDQDQENHLTHIDAAKFLIDTKHIVSTKVISLKIQKPTDVIASNLNIRKDEDVYALKRVRSDRDGTFYFSNTYLPVKLFPNLLSESETAAKGLYNYIDQTEYKITTIKQSFEIGACDKESASLFNCKLNSPLWIVTNNAFSHDLPVEYGVSTYQQRPGTKIEYIARREEYH
jgi:GntR family transcriptional regulator